MTTQEKLEKIKARCQKLLAEQREKPTFTMPTGYFECAAAAISCAGPAEAGWRATIAVIEFINRGDYYESRIADEILTAWPDSLL